MRLWECDSCGFVSGESLDARPAAARYADYYHRPAPPAPVSRYHEWLAHAEEQVGVGRLLEVGAGRGAFLRVAADRGWAIEATEVSGSALDELAATGATVFAGDIALAGYPDARFDLVVSLEVLEHVPEPMEHLREYLRVTRPGGLLLLTTPNFAGLSRRFLKLRWRVVTPEHLGYFTPTTLRRAVSLAGYRSVHARSRSLDISSWRAGLRSSTPQFDPHTSAGMRDAVETSWVLSRCRNALNGFLGLTDLGDSLLLWARR